jgi:small-conductance mechanosensitive channel
VSAQAGSWLYTLLVIGGSIAVGIAVDLLVAGLLRHDAGPARRIRTAFAKTLRGQFEVWAVLIGLAVFKPLDHVSWSDQQLVARIVIIVAVVSVTLFLARLAGSLIHAYLSQDSVTAPSGTIFVNLARLVIWVIGLTFVLGALGVQIGPLVASLGVVGIAVSLGLQDTLANFFSGLQITLSRQILPGQYIRLSTLQEGTVVDVTWRNTTLLGPGNDLIIIPNSVIATTLITNFTAEDEEHVEAIPFTVSFGSDLDEVMRIALGVARSVRDAHIEAVDEFEPACRFRGFGPEGVSAVVTIRVARFQDRLDVVSDLIRRLHDELAEGGITFGTGLSVTTKAPL